MSVGQLDLERSCRVERDLTGGKVRDDTREQLTKLPLSQEHEHTVGDNGDWPVAWQRLQPCAEREVSPDRFVALVQRKEPVAQLDDNREVDVEPVTLAGRVDP